MIRLLILSSFFLFSIHKFTFAQTIAFQDVSVLSMEDENIKSNQTVIITDGVINTVGASSDVRIPRRAQVIQGDFFLMPGLAEMHAHIPPIRQGEEYQKDVLAMYMMQGVTTIRGMLGEASHLELREKTATGKIPGPRILTSGPSFNSNSISNPEQAREMVREQVEAGYDLLKFHPGIGLDEFYAIVDEARYAGIDFSGHISYDVGLEITLASGKGTIDHLDRYMEFLAGDAALRTDPPIIYFGYDLTPHVDREKIEKAAYLTANAGVWNVPTNTLLENIFNVQNSIDDMKNWPGMDLMPASMVENWSNFVRNFRDNEIFDEEQANQFLEIRRLLTLALHEQGAGLLLGADAPQIFNPPGYAIHRELELLLAAGLTPFEALTTGTVNVGIYLQEQNGHGKIKEGYKADIIVLDRNPLTSIPFGNYIQGVMSNGIFYNSDDLNQMRKSILERRNSE